jgi:hypothetical protein
LHVIEHDAAHPVERHGFPPWIVQDALQELSLPFWPV